MAGPPAVGAAAFAGALLMPTTLLTVVMATACADSAGLAQATYGCDLALYAINLAATVLALTAAIACLRARPAGRVASVADLAGRAGLVLALTAATIMVLHDSGHLAAGWWAAVDAFAVRAVTALTYHLSQQPAPGPATAARPARSGTGRSVAAELAQLGCGIGAGLICAAAVDVPTWTASAAGLALLTAITCSLAAGLSVWTINRLPNGRLGWPGIRAAVLSVAAAALGIASCARSNWAGNAGHPAAAYLAAALPALTQLAALYLLRRRQLGRRRQPAAGQREQVQYHRLARSSPSFHWWRPAAGTLLLAAMTVFGTSLPTRMLRHLVGYTRNLPLLGGNTNVVLALIGISLTLPVALAVTRWIGARPPGTLASITGRLRWAWLWRCALAAFLSILAGLTLAACFFIANLIQQVHNRPGGHQATAAPMPARLHAPVGYLIASVLVSVAVVSLWTIVQATAEEFLFRGWLLQAVGAFTRRPWPAIVVQAAAFTVLHGLHGTVWGYLDLIVSSIVLGWLVTTTGGLEAAIAMHVLWDMLLASPGTALAAVYPGLADPAAVNASSGGWQLPAVDLAVLTCYTLAVRRAHRRRQHTSPPTSTPPPRPVPHSLPATGLAGR